ncbi:hypothetical protein L6452_20499 [Arctium lappa]|uniref:Uncharacterized protein n=1 Tax=Arctium lappa TaxID=4217 RepID=A0ACB9BB08_ARCLA|nr:hypothetical protein L6452_20499 [Arctium lappa]
MHTDTSHAIYSRYYLYGINYVYLYTLFCFLSAFVRVFISGCKYKVEGEPMQPSELSWNKFDSGSRNLGHLLYLMNGEPALKSSALHPPPRSCGSAHVIRRKHKKTLEILSPKLVFATADSIVVAECTKSTDSVLW